MSKKILIVEDDKVLAETMQAILSDTGLYETALAIDGETGRRLAEEFKPDLIILDLLMAGTSGMDLLHAWQETGLSKRIPVVVATNLDQLPLINHALNMGVRQYFLKSEMSPEAIVDNCAKVLAEVGNEPPVSPSAPSASASGPAAA